VGAIIQPHDPTMMYGNKSLNMELFTRQHFGERKYQHGGHANIFFSFKLDGDNLVLKKF
jgi:hypothetical protein